MSAASDEQVLQEANAYLEKNWEQMLADLAQLVEIPSVEDLPHACPENNQPWGPEPARALEAALALAESMGFESTNMEGHIGYADFAGQSDTQIGIIGHVDVVAAGPGWTVEPFQVTRREGYLLGRGVIDDKGPSLMALHAMKFWYDRQQAGASEQFPYSIRFIFGANEETGMGDVPYYQERFEDPAFLFTPDAEFPVSYGEKGLFGTQLVGPAIPAARRMVQSYQAGVSSNAVPGEARAVVCVCEGQAANLPDTEGVQVTQGADGLVTVEAKGKSAHASTPELGTNANEILLGYLLDNNLCAAEERSFLELCFSVASAYDGSKVGIACTDEDFGPLTCVGSVLRYEGDSLVLDVDVRYPTSTTGAAVQACFETLAQQAGGIARLVVDKPVFLVPRESPAIQALLAAYNEATGEARQAFTMGGGTYARKFKCGASFGAEKPWKQNPDWVGGMHGPDEGVAEEDLKDAFRIYVLTLAKLMKLDL